MRKMAFARTIVAFLVALSLAMLPMAGAFAVPKDEVTASEAAPSGHDCCDPEDMPPGSPMKQCQSSAGCAAKCSSFFAVTLAVATIYPPTRGTDPLLASDPIRAHATSPPFRPPRV
jgi:hypothetical protein